MVIDCGSCRLERHTDLDWRIIVETWPAGWVRLDYTDRWEIAYVVDGAFRGKGYASAAVAGMTKAALATGRVKAIYARVQVGNAASVRVLQKAGYVLESATLDVMTFVAR